MMECTVLFKRFVLFCFLIFCSNLSISQVIFNESFDEGDDVVAGTDDVGGTTWSTSCADCLDSGDFFKISGGKLVGQDTNGPATLQTGIIDISSCSFIEITFDLSEEGTLEACGTGCNSVDFVQLEYNIDGSGWEVPADAFFCTGGCAGVMVIQADDIDGGFLNYSTGCINGGAELEIRITVQAWAASERWIIDNLNVSCSAGPELDAGADQTVCEGTEVILEAFNPEGADLSWTDGVEDGVGFVSELGTTEYFVTATLGVCSSVDSVNVTVLAPETAIIDPVGTFTETDPPVFLSGSPVDGTWSADCIGCIDPVTGEFDPVVAGPGLWEICYEVGIPPCGDDTCITIEVTEVECLLDGDITFNNPLCFGQSDGSVAVNITGESGEVIYVITNESGEVINVSNSNTVSSLPAGWYYFLVTDELSCQFIDSVFLEDPNPLEWVEFGTELAYCRMFDYQNGHGVLYATATGGTPGYVYLWENIESGETMNSSTWANLNPGDYRLTVTDDNNCTLIREITLDSLNPVADFDLSSSQFIAEWEGAIPVEVHFINTSSNFSNPNSPSADTNFIWNFGIGADVISHDFYEEFDQNYTIAGEYEVCLTVINENGCKDSTCVLIEVFDPFQGLVEEDILFFVPNAFTPDGSGINDIFQPIMTSNIDPYHFNMKVFNRWGEVVFETYDFTRGWDGTYGNIPAEDGVYLWSIEFGDLSTDKQYEYNGSITLLR